MDGSTDELMTGGWSSWFCVTDLERLMGGKGFERMRHFPEWTNQLQWKISEGCIHFWEFKYGHGWFFFGVCFLKPARLWGVTYERYVLHAFYVDLDQIIFPVLQCCPPGFPFIERRRTLVFAAPDALSPANCRGVSFWLYCCYVLKHI